MCKIAGFGKSETSTPGNMLYEKVNGEFENANYVYVNLPMNVSNKQELYRRYLKGMGNSLSFQFCYGIGGE